MPTVTMLTRDELVERRRTLLEQAGLSEDELRARSEEYMLSPDLTAVLREIDEVDFLLGG